MEERQWDCCPAFECRLKCSVSSSSWLVLLKAKGDAVRKGKEGGRCLT